MIRVKARSGQVFRLADKATADRWVERGYQLVQDEPEKAKPARKAAAKKSAAQSEK